MQRLKQDNSFTVIVENLTRNFGEFTAVKNVSFKVKRGEIFGFLGANGAGKTTTIRMLCGLLLPTSGKAFVAGFDVYTQSEKIKKNIGYMSQKFRLHDPGIIFLDEPTSGVDPVSRRNFWMLIHELAEQGKTVFVTTHFMDEAEYCHRVSIMQEGEIVELDRPQVLKEKYHAGTIQEVF